MLDVTVAQRVRHERVRIRSLPARADAAEAFHQLMESELDGSYVLAATILRDASEAEDAVHDAAVSAWRSWHQLRNADSAPAWFKRIVVNTCRDRLRRRRRRALIELVSARNDNDPARTAPDSSDRAAQRDLVRRALERLSPDERVAVVLRFENDLTVPGIAATLGIAEGTVKSRLHNAIRKLRAAVGEADA